MNRGLLLVVLFVSGGSALQACSSDSVPVSGTGGNHAGGGAGGAGGAPPTAHGNLTLSIQDADHCPVPGKTYVVGDPQGPSSTTPGDRLIDGEHGASIECSVQGSGPYTFSGTIRGMSAEADPVTVTISSGIVNQDRQTGTATLSVYTPQLASTYHSAEGACTVSVVSGNVKAGSLWATLSCTSIAEAVTGQLCAIGASSTFVLENCDGS